MAYHGPSYGLSRECQMKSQAKFDLQRAQEAVDWVEAVTEQRLEFPTEEGLRDQLDFAHALKDGQALCALINRLIPGTIKKINTMKAPFKQRENLEMFLKGCVAYGLKSQDLFQVNDLYENKNLYMVVDCLYGLGGMAQKKSYDGPCIGVKVAQENKRNFSEEVLSESKKVIGLQYGSNKGASQAGMSAYGTARQIIPDESQRHMSSDSHKVIGLQSGSNKGASQTGMTPYGAARQIIPDAPRPASADPDSPPPPLQSTPDAPLSTSDAQDSSSPTTSDDEEKASLEY
ncbi:transgelin-3-like isoform X2 [Oratosquilla oratoria]|uniref:transgelin-3-like isoform X2 n=1 Tax=Oratosquilla oratoria TaxID=337810 RepID=UPI003F7707DD